MRNLKISYSLNWNWFSIIFSIQILLGVLFFIFGYFGVFEVFGFASNNSMQNVDVNQLIPYLKFISKDSSEMTTKICFNNFILSICFYILNIFTLGISGIFFLMGGSFVLGTALRQNQSFLSVVFLLLESIGVLSTCFLGTYLPYKKSKRELSTKKMFAISLAFLAILGLVYFIAGNLEANLIKGELK